MKNQNPSTFFRARGISSILIILIIVGVLVAAGGIYLYQKTGFKGCTQEAKQCPDGSYVGRTGPNCEFVACPVSDNCAIEGKQVRASGVGFPANCCSGLKAMYGYAQEDCSVPGIPGDIGTCSNCGNGVCESQNNENKCNCPQDCSSNSTADWKTYRNEEFGYELRYPKDWKISHPSTEPPYSEPVESESYFSPKEYVYFPPIIITIIGAIWDDYTSYICQDNGCDKLNINNYDAIKKEERDPLQNKIYIVVFIKGPANSVYELKGEKSEPFLGIFNQILSTFKFISQ